MLEARAPPEASFDLGGSQFSQSQVMVAKNRTTFAVFRTAKVCQSEKPVLIQKEGPWILLKEESPTLAVAQRLKLSTPFEFAGRPIAQSEQLRSLF